MFVLGDLRLFCGEVVFLDCDVSVMPLIIIMFFYLETVGKKPHINIFTQHQRYSIYKISTIRRKKKTYQCKELKGQNHNIT
jgi:hypothetical protein